MDPRLKERMLDFSAAYSAFNRTLDQVDSKKYDKLGVCGSWSPKDVVSHLVGWDKSMEDFIANPEGFDPVPLLDSESFNAHSVSDRKDQLWKETMDEWQCGYIRLLESLAGVPEESKIIGRLCDWLVGRKNDYEHHTVQLRSWID